MAHLIGIDIGTSGTKTVLFNEKGETVSQSTYEYGMKQLKPGWAEQNPGDWWKAVCYTLRDTLSKSGISKDDISGIGLSGQMHGLVLLNGQGQVIRDSIIWCDTRSVKECSEITERVTFQKLMDITCNPALTGFTASKLLWVRNNEPYNYEKTKKILLPKDYIRYKLTGEYATEVSDASGMQFLNVPRRCWSDEITGLLGVDKSLLADVYESYQVTGYVTEEAAELTGLRKGTPVVGGAGDQAAGGVGNGIVKNGVVSATVGTSGVVFAYSDTVKKDPLGRTQTFCHAVPGAWHIMGVTKSAGLSLRWFRDQFCSEEKSVASCLDVDPYIIMDKECEKSPAGAAGLIYLPYLMGERTPHLDNDAKGVFFGVTPTHTKADFIRSVMEGVAFAMNDCLNVIKETGVAVDEIRASGGGGKSKTWKAIQADIYKSDITTINASEGPALGAALLAGTGTGVYKSVEEACSAVIKVKDVHKTDEKLQKVYDGYYTLFRSLYGSLKEDYKKLSLLLG